MHVRPNQTESQHFATAMSTLIQSRVSSEGDKYEMEGKT